MKPIAFILLSWCVTSLAFAQTQVTIIGTAHSKTKKFSSDILLNMLNKIKPDVILLELDTSLMDDQGNYKLFVLNGNEDVATRQYKTINKDLVIRRFDLENRNAYYASHQTFAIEDKLSRTVDSVYNSNGFSEADKLKMDTVFQTHQADNRMSQMDIYTMNSKEYMALSAKKQYWMYVKQLEVIAKTQALKQYYDFYKEDGDFWIRRNKRMADNIVAYIYEFTGKKIIVLTGATHKYILTDNLKPLQAKYHFKLNDLPQ